MRDIRLVKLTAAAVGKLIFWLSGLMPRNPRKLCVGAYKNRFTDNGKYLYLHFANQPGLEVIWISADTALVKILKSRGLMAARRWSVQGIWHALTAGVYCYTSYVGDINQWLGNGATRVNLWHGSPLKTIEFDIKSGPMAERFTPPFTLAKRLEYHQEYLKPDLMLAPSETVRDCFSSAFRIPASQITIADNPRTRFYELSPWAKPRRPSHWRPRLILYAPSWKDNGEVKSLKDTLAPDRLEALLQKLDATLLVRLHPNEAHLASGLGGYKGIEDISHREDIYDLLPALSLLITDYSSIYIDALKYDIPLAFYRGDNEGFLQTCRKAYGFTENLEPPGPLVTNSAELCALLGDESSFNKMQAAEARHQHRRLYWQSPLPDPFLVLAQRLGLELEVEVGINLERDQNQPGVDCTAANKRLS
ncbi:CDP-glycerol glycerophosphotransferase family protein [Shewanella sp. JM162201]|uniref:CDP-glycerol glycerophosphotransferase family protein n=1 Tax=Shewanella jiangmenensis TaxID=2837387 RepID=A0ABS5UZS1_9GAMM|nr:CDP-glycerol glycerophosphotransferase family protein [Shewanella jiangmenensis]MBT1442991.1 CDP-glycerol glycerophosphotransferase family protein [Shewanella jiangmenensis]